MFSLFQFLKLISYSVSYTENWNLHSDTEELYTDQHQTWYNFVFLISNPTLESQSCKTVHLGTAENRALSS